MTDKGTPLAKRIMKVLNVAHTQLYRRSGGRLGRTLRIGQSRRNPAPVCLVTTTGRRTGRPRTVPLIHIADGDNLVLIASQGGRPENPVWYGNLTEHPDVEVEVGADKRPYRTHTVPPGDERQRLWDLAVGVYPDFATYQTKTARTIPVVLAEPI